MDTREELADLFAKLEALGERLGSRIVPRSSDEQQRLEELASEGRPLIRKALSEIETIDSRRARAPSAYHALLFLRTLEQATVSASRNHRPIFRGQSNTYDPVPSRFRAGVDQALESRCAEIFYSLLLTNRPGAVPPDEVSEPSLKRAYEAIGQHYGIRTSLLDFSPDPAVAVYFATKDPPRVPGSDAIIYYLPLNKVWDLGGSVFLVPAFIERVYLQRGIFVQVPENDTTAFRQNCFELLLPHDPDFAVVRDGSAVDILQPDHWIAKAVAWAREWAHEIDWRSDFEKHARNFWDATFKELGVPPYVDQANGVMDLARWVDNVSSLLYWLVITVVEQEEFFDSRVMDFIARDNRGTLSEFVDIFEKEAEIFDRGGDADRAAARRQMCALIRQSIANF